MFRLKSLRTASRIVFVTAAATFCSERSIRSNWKATTFNAFPFYTLCNQEMENDVVNGLEDSRLAAVHLTMPDGSKYFGEMEDGQRSRHGESWDTKGHYVGSWASNVKEGCGVLRYNNGFTYEGEFSGDLPHGRGIVTLPSGEKLEGEFVNGVLQGHELPEFGWSKVTTRNGFVAEGQFTFPTGNVDEFDGHGRVTLPGEWMYEGDVLQGKPEGEGVITMYFSNLTLVLESLHVNGQRVKDNKITILDRSGTSVLHRNEHEQLWLRFTSVHGNVIEGELVDGQLHGPCTFTFPDGVVGKGQVYKGAAYGEWTIYYLDGSTEKGNIPLSFKLRLSKWWEERK